MDDSNIPTRCQNQPQTVFGMSAFGPAILDADGQVISDRSSNDIMCAKQDRSTRADYISKLK